MGSEKGTENETSEPNMRSKQSSPYDPEAKGNLSAKANEFVSLLEADKQKIEELEYRIKALQAKSSEGLRNDVNSQVRYLGSTFASLKNSGNSIFLNRTPVVSYIIYKNDDK
mmetsp:Transcript_3477/g.4374  ORF Transcript_3477/g.4374 Transcript_3477/m.4374 type:complete len:112 (+) Transcript_3477:336-671(+)|eukprot:CAMPEP_0204822300 /NCGR_PEP_ID=MMETSP1346-20131115/476_1 /ASSEMBLY_ACC=CAM_ASM_000771 /TAXON_ID=215587 /ORGANISM="Aplanochytrium stocchinoi, Strain GSBS06" /LENGTH=111 /DNA_ID=CAMNT_0051948417 /DNA_START=303 /DNA_END=641 /DNA_ORIENTATION=-